jgi:hypothetical protein
MTRTPSLGKRAIRCHEPRQHGCNELDRIADWLPAFTPKDLRIGDKVARTAAGSSTATFTGFSSINAKILNFTICVFTLDMVRARDRG